MWKFHKYVYDRLIYEIPGAVTHLSNVIFDIRSSSFEHICDFKLNKDSLRGKSLINKDNNL